MVCIYIGVENLPGDTPLKTCKAVLCLVIAVLLLIASALLTIDYMASSINYGIFQLIELRN